MYPRKTAPKVRGGKVQRKNRTAPSPEIYGREPLQLQIRRLPAGRGYSHVLSRREVERFVRLIPDLAELSRGLMWGRYRQEFGPPERNRDGRG